MDGRTQKSQRDMHERQAGRRGQNDQHRQQVEQGTWKEARMDRGPINLNAASREELVVRMEGVDPEIADKIIRYRDKKGGFENVQEVRQVEGIDEACAQKVIEQSRV